MARAPRGFSIIYKDAERATREVVDAVDPEALDGVCYCSDPTTSARAPSRAS